jgi:hypothetical protein
VIATWDYLSVASPQQFGTFLPQAHHRRFLAIAFTETRAIQTRCHVQSLGDGEW